MFLLISVAAGLVTLYMAALAVKPLLERQTITVEEWSRLEDESATLLARRDRLVEELRDLELEAALNKVDEHDLVTLRGRFEAAAIEVVRQLDERRAGYAARIERAVSAPAGAAASPPATATAPAAARGKAGKDKRRGKGQAQAGATHCTSCDAALPPGAVFCDACGHATAAAVPCAGCGAPNRTGARFCRTCGTGMAMAEAAR